MAADTAAWMDNLIVEHRHKIFRLKDGRLFAGSGSRPIVDACLKWLNGEGEKPDAAEEGRFGGVLANMAGVWKINHRFMIYDVSASPYVVEGAHNEFLLGALAAGATAEEAVRLAIRYGDSAAGEVQVERA